MKVVKLYRKPDEPEYYKLVRIVGNEMLLDYPISKPNRFRMCRWIKQSDVYIEWIRTYEGE